MTILNRPSNGHVATMIVVWRTLRVLGAMPRERLESLCMGSFQAESPGSYVLKKEKETPILVGTVATHRRLGMFTFSGKDDLMELQSPFDQIHPYDIDSLRTAMLDLFLKPENCPLLMGDDSAKRDYDDTTSGSSDFVRVAAWTLAQDPYKFSGLTSEQDIKDRATTQGMPDLFGGTGRMPAFQEWAYFCGLGMPTVNGFVMNPARAMRVALKRDPMAGRLSGDLPFADFLADMGRLVPVLEGGQYRRPIDDRIDEAVLREKNHRVSPCTSLALLQLYHEGEVILLDLGGDVTTYFTLTGRSGSPLGRYSHVRRGIPRSTITPSLNKELQS
jgi:hypothetical protein